MAADANLVLQASVTKVASFNGAGLNQGPIGIVPGAVAPGHPDGAVAPGLPRTLEGRPGL